MSEADEKLGQAMRVGHSCVLMAEEVARIRKLPTLSERLGTKLRKAEWYLKRASEEAWTLEREFAAQVGAAEARAGRARRDGEDVLLVDDEESEP